MNPEMSSAVVRGMILQALDLEYPNGLSDLAVLAMIQGAGHGLGRLAVWGHLEYLAGPGKEYLTLERKPRHWLLAKLTPKGKDLLAGVIDDDPGVQLAR